MSSTQTNANVVTQRYWLQFLDRAVGAMPKSDLKRETPRFPLQGEVQLWIENETEKRWLSLMNVSREGITARGNTEIQLGTRVILEMNPEGSPITLRGEVVHCTGTLGGFKIGVRLEFDS